MTLRPIILGIDGTSVRRIGWGAVAALDGAALGCGCVELEGWNGKDGPGPHFHRDVARAVRRIRDAVDAIMRRDDWEVAQVVSERPSGGPSGFQSGLDLSLVAGMVAQAAGRRFLDARMVLLRPQRWKSLAGVPRFADPEDGRKQLHGVAAQNAAASWYHQRHPCPANLARQDVILRAQKPGVMARAIEVLGSVPSSQDAADGLLLALAGNEGPL